MREIALRPAFLTPFTQTRAVALIASGRIEVDRLISRSVPLAGMPEAIRTPARPGEVKVLIDPAAQG